MLKLLKFEYRRLFRRISLYVCLGIVAVPVLYVFYLIGTVYFDENDVSRMSMFQILQQMISIANLNTLIVVFTSIFGCEDKARGTVKTIYSLGYSRYKIFFFFFSASATAAAMMYAVVLIFGLICGLLFAETSYQDVSSEGILGRMEYAEEPNLVVYIIQQFMIIMGVHAFYYMIAELIQKTGVSIVLGIFAPGIVSSIYGVITFIMCNIAEGNSELVEKLGEAYSTFLMYWLPTTMSSVVGLFGGMVKIDYVISIIVNIGYVMLFGGLGMLITCKKQIK